MTVVSVDPHGFSAAASNVGGAASQLSTAFSVLSGVLSGTGEMAGTDDAGVKWGEAYDKGVTSVVKGVDTLLSAFSSIEQGLVNSGYNHSVSESASAGRESGGEGFDVPAGVPQVCHASPPSSHGSGNSDLPDWWEFLGDLIGAMWPDGDTGKLRNAASAWDGFASDVERVSSSLTVALSPLQGFQSPELEGISSTVSQVRKSVDSVKSAAESLAKACRDFAQHIDETHQESEQAAAELLAEIAATIAIGFVLTWVTAGLSDLIATFVAGGRMAAYAARIAGFIARLAEKAGSIAADVARFAGASERMVAVAERIVVSVPRISAQMAKNSVSSVAQQVATNGVMGRPAAEGLTDAGIWGALPGGGATRKTVAKAESISVREAENVSKTAAKVSERRLDKAVEVPFKRNPKHDEAEFLSQLKRQEEGLNNLTVEEFLNNRAAFKEFGRKQKWVVNGVEKSEKQIRKDARELEIVKNAARLLKEQPNLTKVEARKLAQDSLKGKTALHDPDIIAGGHGNRITGFGDARINSSLGSQWRSRADELERAIREAVKDIPPEEWGKIKLNVRLGA